MKCMIVLLAVVAVAFAQYAVPPQYGEQLAGADGHNGAWRGEGIPESQDNGQWNQPAAYSGWAPAPNWAAPAPNAWAAAPGNNNPLWNVHARPAGV